MKKLREAVMKNCTDLYYHEKNVDVWCFIGIAVMIEQLKKMTGCDKYSIFIEKWLSQINPIYKEFSYQDKSTILSEQMYSIFRNGLIHSFTLKSDRGKIGKTNSLLLSHDAPHLLKINTNGMDSCVLNAKSLIDDLCHVTNLIFQKAEKDAQLKTCIEDYFNSNPPIVTLSII